MAMHDSFELVTAFDPPPSLARTEPPTRPPLRIGAVQIAWDSDATRHRRDLAEGVRRAASCGAKLVCLQELTLSPYFAVTAETATEHAEEIPGGPTCTFAAELAREVGAFVHASLYERAEGRGLGFNTAVVLSPQGELVSRVRKLHIPVTAGYYEDHHFQPGPPEGGIPVVELEGVRFGFPTCWDQWFPELARAYALQGAEVIVYPTAIGSEPELPDFDTEPLWEKVIVANGIANGTYMVAVNRIGKEPPLTFYGSSFISDPYGRVLVKAPRDRPAILVADLDLDQGRDWLTAFPFLETRRPDAYSALVGDKGKG